MSHPSFDEEGDDDGPRVWVVEDRPALREGKVFVDYDERARIAENLERAETTDFGSAAESSNVCAQLNEVRWRRHLGGVPKNHDLTL